MDKLLDGDPELARFIEEMEQNQRLKKTSEKLTNECWEICVTSPNVSKFDSKTEACLANCVERFIDTSTFIVNAFSNRVQSDHSSSLSSSSGFSDPEMILEDKFSSSSSSKAEDSTKSKSGFKFW